MDATYPYGHQGYRHSCPLRMKVSVEAFRGRTVGEVGIEEMGTDLFLINVPRLH